LRCAILTVALSADGDGDGDGDNDEELLLVVVEKKVERCKVVELFKSTGLKNPLLYGTALYLA
jgi:hypothetical protein